MNELCFWKCMHFSSFRPNASTLPPAQEWKRTSVADVVRLIRCVEVLDPTWRFVTLRQFEEMRNKVRACVPESELKRVCKGDLSNIQSIRSGIRDGELTKTPFMARELAALARAEGRQNAWNDRTVREFQDAPLSIRLVLNARVRPDSNRLNDHSGNDNAGPLVNSIRKAVDRGWLHESDDGALNLSPEARSRVIGLCRSNIFKPVGLDSLGSALAAHLKGDKAVGQLLIELAEEEFRQSSRLFAPQDAAKGRVVLRTSPVGARLVGNLKAPSQEQIIQFALETIALDSRFSVDVKAQACVAALKVLEVPGASVSSDARVFVRQLARMMQVVASGEKTARGFGAALVEKVLPAMRNLGCLHEEFTPCLESLMNPRHREELSRLGAVLSLQQTALSVAGSWLGQPDLSAKARIALQNVLLEEATGLNPRYLSGTSLYWLSRYRQQFTTEQLEGVAIKFYEENFRRKLPFSVYFSCVEERFKGFTELCGSMELLRALALDGRLTKESAITAYAFGRDYIGSRCRDTNDGLWKKQKGELESLLADLDAAHGGEPRRDYESSIGRTNTKARVPGRPRSSGKRGKRVSSRQILAGVWTDLSSSPRSE